jgi:hypothetical protein
MQGARCACLGVRNAASRRVGKRGSKSFANSKNYSRLRWKQTVN